MIARWTTVDPSAEHPDQIAISPFAYGLNNPVKNIDPDGRCVPCLIWAGEAIEAGLVATGIVTAAVVTTKIIANHHAGDNGYSAPRDAIPNIPTPILKKPIVKNEGKDKPSSDNADKKERTKDDPLPRDKHGNPVTDEEGKDVAHTQLGTAQGRKGPYTQGREFDENGKPVKDVDHTDHGRPQNHTNPHQHDYIPNPTEGTPQRGPAKPLTN